MRIQSRLNSASRAASVWLEGNRARSLDPKTFDDGRAEKRLGWAAAAAFFGVFFLWGAFAHLDAAATASGVIAVSGSRQAVQHKDGGNVAAIYVREGQHVRRGQLLIRLSGDETLALAQSLQSQVIDLQAQQARLIAERDGHDLEQPAEFAHFKGALAVEAEHALAQQRDELVTRARELSDQGTVLTQQASQARSRIGGLNGQISSNNQQDILINDQLVGLRSLASKGFASLNRVRDLERSAAALEGDTARLHASVAESGGQVRETEHQILALRSQRQQQVNEDLRTVNFSLDDLLPKLIAAQQTLGKTEIRAPVDGQVVGLQLFSPGAVVTPGQKLMDIVPAKANLVIDAKVSPTDADDMNVGQAAEVRVSAFHDRGLPVLHGTVTQVSADSFEDQRTGATYFTAEVTVPASEFRDLERQASGRERIKPGLPVEVIVPLRKRTLLQYLLEPLDQAFWRSMREH